jgi:hypothetical protein
MCETSANLPQEQAEALLQQRLRGRLWELRVVGRPGGVILQGRALDYHTKQLGQHIAMRELRLTVVANEIEVRHVSLTQQPGNDAG